MPVPRNMRPAYARGTRSADGRPGPNYWQNRADYIIKVNFDPATRLLAGTVNINYQNNSPDSLRQIWFKLYPNLFQKGAPHDGRFQPGDLGDGVKIEQLSLNGQPFDVDKLLIDNTNMTLPLRRALGPRQALQISVTYSYILNRTSHQRTGEVAPGAAFVAYFFPRVAVYDDVDGWNRNPYTGTQEFYNDFGRFSVDVTVPRNFIVWATGDLTNAGKVLAPKYHKRLVLAGKKDGIVSVIDSAEASLHDATAPNAYNTWHFEAREVTDFVFATSDHYAWEATSLVVDPATKRRTRVDAVYDAKHDDFEEAAKFGRKTIQAMSYVFPKWPFPYSHETIFDGLDQMEYPMMANDNPSPTRESAITLTDHEIFHTMFPFYMGTNETKYAWMDEGWATLGEWLISPLIKPKLVDSYGMVPYSQAAATEDDPPIMTLSTQLSGQGYFLNSYPKPALGYLFVKDMLGDELFTRALHHYIRTWHGKHPIPFDFFYSMNAGAGRDLNWFWQRWFFDGGYPDLGLTRVARDPSGGGEIEVTAVGSKPVPIDLTVTYDNGSTEDFHESIAAWQAGNRTHKIEVESRRQIVKVTLGSTYVPDANPADNVWVATGE